MLGIDKVRRELYGSLSRWDCNARHANEDALAIESAAKTSVLEAFERKRPSRKPFSEHLRRKSSYRPSVHVTPPPTHCPLFVEK